MYDFAVPVVAVPVRNEEARLPRLVAALSRQTVILPGRPLRVVLVLNNIDDGSRSVARAAGRRAANLDMTVVDVAFPPQRAHAGSARRLALDIAARQAPHGVVMTTDADAVPADDWVEQNLRAIQAGAHLVGGRVVGDPEEERRLGHGFLRRARTHARYQALCDELASLIDPIAHDPWPRHHDHIGASIAVRSDVYRVVGGMEPLPFREDLAFVSKARAAGFRLRHAPEVAVTVSARTRGRARGGMADCLRNWVREETEGAPLLLECPEDVENRLRLRRAIRDLHDLEPDAVFLKLRQWGAVAADEPCEARPLPACALIERFAADDPDARGTVAAALAIATLERRIAALKELADAA